MSDQLFMQRALDLAQKGLGKVSPNPMVGCVIVHDDLIIGEGWHEKFGGPHAEVNAFNSVENEAHIKDSTVYVTLEPCTFHGKTPACTDLLLKHRPKRVVIGTIDPNPKVSGGGVKKLKSAGVEVEVGVLETKCRRLNRRFWVNNEEKRPYVILKWAQTADGFIAKKNGDSKWISGTASRQLVHKWRAEEDAILVGKNTVLNDNPSLTARDWDGENPVRVVLDKNASVQNQFNVLDGSVQTLVYSTLPSDRDEKVERVIVHEDDYLNSVLNDLLERNIGSVLVEGGAKVLQSFIEVGLWDEARVFTAKTFFGEGLSAPLFSGDKYYETQVESDLLAYYTRN